MPIIYYNQGSGGSYAGIGFTNGQTLLGDIHDQLVLAGWPSLLDDRLNGQIRLKGVDGLDSCYVQITANVLASANSTVRLNIRGSLDDTFTQLSPDMATNLLTTSGIGPSWELDYTQGQANSFWLTADSGSFAIMIKDASEPNSIYSAWRFGFYDRHSTNDADAWGLGPLWTCTKGQYVARSAFDGSEWHNIEADFDSNAGRTTTSTSSTTRDYYNQSAHPMGYFNPFTQCLTGLDSYSSSIVPGAKRRFGAPNPYTGTIQPALHYIQEGFGNDFSSYPPINESQITGLSLYFRGTVKHVACGFAHVPVPGTIISSGSQIFICPGLQGLGLRVG